VKPISHGCKRVQEGSFVVWVEKDKYKTMTTGDIPKPVDDDGCGVPTLLKYVPPENRTDFSKYVNDLIASADYEFDPTFLGFISDYIAFASILDRKVDIHESRPPWDRDRSPRAPLTIYDVGCGGALQHLVFDSRIHYVGIDMIAEPEPKFFRPNCRFVKGRFSDIVESLQIDRQSAIGIANMSLLYFETDDSALALFDRTFRRKFVL
jgi:hypothetical protein